MKNFIVLIIFLFSFSLTAQEEVYYIGGGNSREGVKISGSFTGMNTSPQSTLDGSGMDAKYMEATRLLAQSTLGYTEGHVEEVMEMGIEGWVKQQMEMPASYLSDILYDILESTSSLFYKHVDREIFESDLYRLRSPRSEHFYYSWWHTVLNNEDLLRQRVAFAMSEILVVSVDSDLAERAEGVSHYYDLLLKYAFGNYRDLLFDVTVSPSMGFYLSHLNNPKTNIQRKTTPDENYAREIMQLFTVGLYELNQDGSRKKDENGNDIPTYGQDDIKGLAKVFTGLGGSEFSTDFLYYREKEMHSVPDIGFGYNHWDISLAHPMTMYEEFHEPGMKHIIDNNTIPSGNTGMEDVNMALDILFNHDNVGPFVGRRLIQRLVKSNPSPEYIERVSRVFTDNGQGVRGDMKAVIFAILLDEEARSCEWQQNEKSGMLREPLIRQLNLKRSVNRSQNELGYFNSSYVNMNNTKQNPLTSVSVFNFFLPDYQPVGRLSDLDLYAPEFQLHDSHTAIGYINLLHRMTYWESLGSSHGEFPIDWELKNIQPDYSQFDRFNNDSEALINHLDKFYGHGRLSDNTRNIIRGAIKEMNRPWHFMYRDHIKTALNLFLISPDYTILK